MLSHFRKRKCEEQKCSHKQAVKSNYCSKHTELNKRQNEESWWIKHLPLISQNHTVIHPVCTFPTCNSPQRLCNGRYYGCCEFHTCNEHNCNQQCTITRIRNVNAILSCCINHRCT